MVVLIPGTWGEKRGETDWWRLGSVWNANLRNAGLALLDPTEAFEWSTALAISDGTDPTWRTAGLALKWYCEAKGPGFKALSLIAHSHGGQVVAHALASGLHVHRVITVATPVRQDMQDVWALARPHIEDAWTHLYTEEEGEPMQYLGSLPLGHAEDFTRSMPLATKNIEVVPAVSHHAMMWPGDPWNRMNLWQYAS
jgi:pimeloyl-ACP methyl ester carboxylesterase